MGNSPVSRFPTCTTTLCRSYVHDRASSKFCRVSWLRARLVYGSISSFRGKETLVSILEADPTCCLKR